LPNVQVVEIQRSRLLAAAVVVIDEYGYTNASVERITSRARISRRTFYELFDGRDGCLIALIDDVAESIERETAAADLDGLPWHERVRGGLWAILSFLDREPALARICVAQALRGGPSVMERREEILARLATVLDEGRTQGARSGECTPLTAEGLVGAAFAIVYARLLKGERGPLTELLGELMGMIVLPYLGPAAARREQARPAPALPPPPRREPSTDVEAQQNPLEGLPLRVTYRTARALECIAGRPGLSNRAVADCVGISDRGQISRLLARLERLGLTANDTDDGHLRGEPNSWRLTPMGRQLAQRLGTGRFMTVAGDTDFRAS
jgi:AcrR family transcriptional regulator